MGLLFFLGGSFLFNYYIFDLKFFFSYLKKKQQQLKIARSTINNNLGNNNKKDIKESTDSNVTIEDEDVKLDRISK